VVRILATGLADDPAEVLSGRRVPPSATPMTGSGLSQAPGRATTCPCSEAFLIIGSCLYHHPTVDPGLAGQALDLLQVRGWHVLGWSLEHVHPQPVGALVGGTSAGPVEAARCLGPWPP
jgi:hypothetical protein